jgi:predicted GNAT superfamily acetyltransferase
MAKYKVVDWGDDAYREHGGEVVLARFEHDGALSFSFDGGRLDVSGHSATIWIYSHQWSIREDLDDDEDN